MAGGGQNFTKQVGSGGAVSTWPISRKTAIVGIGSTPMARRAEQSLGGYATDAALAAIADAGLQRSDIDGYVGCPGAPNAAAMHADGIDEVSAGFMVGALGVKNPRWVLDIHGLPTGAVAVAAQAVASGQCNYALVVRAMYNPTGVRYEQVTAAAAAGPAQFVLPYGLAGAGGRHAHWLQWYMHTYGATREELFTVVKTDREHAQLNPIAFWRGKPITIEDYLNARWIYEPMCLFDCDIPVTAAGALVITTAERARDLPHRPAYISGVATSTQPQDALFEAAGVSREAVDMAQIYDGFSHFVWYWLEQMGFCPTGEAHSFTQGGRISRGGALPLNTFGGSLGEGRLHGFGHVREAALQIMGRAGERQVSGAEHCAVAVGVGVPGNISTYLMVSNT